MIDQDYHTEKDKETEKQIESLLDLFVVYIVIVLNPDGYVYTFTDDRMWRKNRRPLERSGKVFDCEILSKMRNVFRKVMRPPRSTRAPTLPRTSASASTSTGTLTSAARER